MMLRLLIIFLFSNALIAQNNSRNTFYINKNPKQVCIYDHSEKKWMCTEYYFNGKVLSTFSFDTLGYVPTGFKINYDLNGHPAYTINYKDGVLHGPFTEFYCDGSLKISGQFYNNFKTGKWVEHYPNGKLKSIQHYRLTPKDSVAVDLEPERITRLIISYGNLPDFGKAEATPCVPSDSLSNPAATDDMTVFEGEKTGTWLFYNIKGHLIQKQIFVR